jgi:sarcosine oxidase
MSAPLVVVIGLGATGSAALYQLARRGVAAIGIEQFALGHERGSSHGPTRIIRLAHFENAEYVPLMRRAYALWHELESVAGIRLLHVNGILEIGPPDAEIVRGTLAATQRHDLTPEILDARTLMRRYPAFRLPHDWVGVLQRDGGTVEARKAIETNISVATKQSARVTVNEKVLAIEPRGNGVRVITGSNKIDADAAIVAGGPWMRSLVPELAPLLRITRQVTAWFAPEDAAQFAADRFPVFILESEFGNHYGLPAYESMGVKVAKHGHLQENVEPDGYQTTISAADEAAIRAPLTQYLPAANGQMLSAETCLYTMTPDGTFIVDRMPGFPQIVIASPCCGHGFKFSPLVGEILADLATGGATKIDIVQFRLQRFTAPQPARA